MALTNAEKQRRWKERNQVVLTWDAEDIAEKLIDMEDQAKLRKVARFINDHLKHPDRSPIQRELALGRMTVRENGRLLGKRALERQRSWRVEFTKDGKTTMGNNVRLGTKQEAEAYAQAIRNVMGRDVTLDILQCDGEPAFQNMTIVDGKPVLEFAEGTCHMLTWREVSHTAQRPKRGSGRTALGSNAR